MKRLISFAFALGMSTLLVACSQNDSNIDILSRINDVQVDKENTEVSVNDEESVSLTKDENIMPVVDSKFYEQYNEDYRNSCEYDAIFEQRCFYLDGNKVYIPTTVRGFERLFNTEFTKSDFNGGYFINFYNDDMELLSVLLPSEKRQEIVEGGDLEKLKDIVLSGVIFEQNESINGGKDIWCRYNVEFEPVAKEEVNEYGYYIGSNMRMNDTCYRFYPACYQAYYEYITGTLPQRSFYNEFGFRWDSIIDYAGKENITIGFGDVTCDALDEMIIETKPENYPEGFHDIRIFTYDTVDKVLREIYYTSIESDGVADELFSVGTGMLNVETHTYTSDEEVRNNDFIVFNRYGYCWNVASFQWRFDKRTYEKSRVANGRNVTEDDYYNEMHIYDRGGIARYGIDDVLKQLSNVGTLTAQGVYRNSLSYAELKKNIAKLDLESIGFDSDMQLGDNALDMENQDYYEMTDSTGEDSLFSVIVTATDGGVNLRSGPSKDYDVLVSMIPNDTHLDVFDIITNSEGKEWYKVDYNGIKGFVAASQVSF